MLKSNSFLAVDFGAGSLKLAEFEPNDVGGLRLRQYAIRSLGLEGSQDATREAVLLKALQGILAEQSTSAKSINLCAPGFHVFSKFVRLPPVDTSKVSQIIEYEAKQNILFPLDEVVWDYQIVGTSGNGELEVLLVAIKSDIVEGLFRVVESAGFRMQLVDASPAALSNAYRYNYGDVEGCTMLLDIGAKTSNLIFFDNGKVFSRSINIGANSITQDFANETKLSFAEADRIKIEKGFVSLGGAYEEPDDPQAAAISKIARQVMTRLHIQVNQTIQFYRSQQGGVAPQRVFLAGGASLMPYTAQFFSEKLNLPVDYFNPFRNIQIDASVNVEELSKVAHAFGEVVGLGLRNLAHCPVEMNLMPKSSIQQQEFSQKKPYFIAAGFGLVLVVFAMGSFYYKVVSMKREKIEPLSAMVLQMRQKDDELNGVIGKIQKHQTEAAQLTRLMEQRYFWPDVMMELRRVLQEAETKTKKKFNNTVDVGIWLQSFTPVLPSSGGQASSHGETGGAASAPPPQSAPAQGGVQAGEMMAGEGGMSGMPAGPASSSSSGAGFTVGSDTANAITTLHLVCQAVSLEKTSPTANGDIAFDLKKEFQASPLFIPEAVELGDIKEGDAPMTFTFGVLLKLKRPFTF